MLFFEGPEEVAPMFKKTLPDVLSVNVKGTLTLEVSAIGEPKPEVEWLKDDKNVAENDRANLNIKGDSYQLTIKDVESNDAGDYKAVAKNKLGIAESCCIAHVNSAPLFVKELQTADVSAGDDAKFVVTVAGRPEADLVWFVNGESVEGQDRFEVQRENDSVSLEIKKCTVEDTGLVKCSASNCVGDVSSEARLTVLKLVAVPEVKEDVLLEVDGQEGEDVAFNLPYSGEDVAVRWLVLIWYHHHC